MKKILGIFVLLFVVVLGACGSKESSTESNEKVIKIGASNVPHAEVLEKVAPILEEEGIKLEIVKYQDYILPNKALADKEIDANYFQSIPYFEQQIKDNGYKFENAGGIHVEPIGVYSKKYKELSELPDGATVIMSNSVSDHGRILSLFQQQGFITLKDGVELTKAEVKDIVENPKQLKFTADIDASMLTQAYENEEGDVVVINANYAIDAGLKPTEDAIALEDSHSEYVNIIAVGEGDSDKEEIKELVKVLRSKEIQDFILEKYEGAVIPVSE